jgi:selenocysteine lyase/cysteine desulfurase
VGDIAKEHNILYLIDASQTAGIYDIDIKKYNIDMIAIAGHKGLLGPQGTGVLYIREGITLKQLKEGGTGSKSEELTQPDIFPDKYESGTHNTPGLAGLNAGVKFILEKGIDNIRKHEEELTSYFIQELQKIPNIKVYGPMDSKKQASVVSINIGNVDSGEISYILDDVYNIATRSGLHCAPLTHKTLGSFEQGTVRFGIGYFNTKDDIDKALNALKDIVNELNI